MVLFGTLLQTLLLAGDVFVLGSAYINDPGFHHERNSVGDVSWSMPGNFGDSNGARENEESAQSNSHISSKATKNNPSRSAHEKEDAPSNSKRSLSRSLLNPVDFLASQGCPTTLHTSLEETTGAYGNIFEVRTTASGSVLLTGIDLYTDRSADVTYEVYIKPGTYVSNLSNSSAWTRIASGTTRGQGLGIGTGLPSPTTPIPPENFNPVVLDANEKYALYVTLVTMDVRYREGVGSEANVVVQDQTGELIIYEGVGARKYPIFDHPDATVGPRLFLGKLHYRSEVTCAPTGAPSSVEAPSATPTSHVSLHPSASPMQSAVPTPTPVSTFIDYRFFLEHKESLKDDLFLRTVNLYVEDTLNELLGDATSGFLYDYAQQHALDVDSVSSLKTPDDGDTPCIPAEFGNICTSIITTVSVTHFPSVSSSDVHHALLLVAEMVSDSLPYASVYVGDEALSADLIISLTGVPNDRIMGKNETNVLERVTLDFLAKRLKDSSDVDVTSVKLIGQDLIVGGEIVQSNTDDGDFARKRAMSATSGHGAKGRLPALRIGSRSMQSGSVPTLDCTIIVTGQHNPTSQVHVDFSELAESSINADDGELVRDLQEEAEESVGSDYFEDVTGASCRPADEPATASPTPAPSIARLGEEKNEAGDGSPNLGLIVGLSGGVIVVLLGFIAWWGGLLSCFKRKEEEPPPETASITRWSFRQSHRGVGSEGFAKLGTA